jgi:prevent-host-death family protein
MNEWELTDANRHLKDLILRAVTEGPQVVRSGDVSVVIIDEAQYLALIERAPTLKELLLRSPSLEGVILDRDTTPMRDVDFG